MPSIANPIVVTYGIFYLTAPIYRVLGRRGSLIITMVFAVLVAATAVQYVVDGLNTIWAQQLTVIVLFR